MGLIYKLSLNPWPSTNHSYIPGNIQSYTLKSKVRYLTYSSSQIMLPPKKTTLKIVFLQPHLSICNAPYQTV